MSRPCVILQTLCETEGAHSVIGPFRSADEAREFALTYMESNYQISEIDSSAEWLKLWQAMQRRNHSCEGEASCLDCQSAERRGRRRVAEYKELMARPHWRTTLTRQWPWKDDK